MQNNRWSALTCCYSNPVAFYSHNPIHCGQGGHLLHGIVPCQDFIVDASYSGTFHVEILVPNQALICTQYLLCVSEVYYDLCQLEHIELASKKGQRPPLSNKSELVLQRPLGS